MINLTDLGRALQDWDPDLAHMEVAELHKRVTTRAHSHGNVG